MEKVRNFPCRGTCVYLRKMYGNVKWKVTSPFHLLVKDICTRAVIIGSFFPTLFSNFKLNPGVELVTIRLMGEVTARHRLKMKIKDNIVWNVDTGGKFPRTI